MDLIFFQFSYAFTVETRTVAFISLVDSCLSDGAKRYLSWSSNTSVGFGDLGSV